MAEENEKELDKSVWYLVNVSKIRFRFLFPVSFFPVSSVESGFTLQSLRKSKCPQESKESKRVQQSPNSMICISKRDKCRLQCRNFSFMTELDNQLLLLVTRSSCVLCSKD